MKRSVTIKTKDVVTKKQKSVEKEKQKMTKDEDEAESCNKRRLCLLNAASITAAHIRVNAAQLFNVAEGVNVASEEVNTAELVSTAYLKEFNLLKWDQQVVSELVALRNFARRYGSRFYTHVVEGVKKVTPITSAEDKAQRRLEVKARKKRFGGNAATKKTQRNLLKQQYENFTAPSSEMLNQTFERLQNFVSQLEILDEKLSQEDVNQKLLRSLSPEWNTHAVVWRNKADLDTISIYDLYNNLKVYEPKRVSTASTQVNAANFTNIDNLSDAVICSFFASHPNSPQLAHEDLQQIHPDDIEGMDLRWQMAMLTMRARSPKWSATTATRGDILLRSVELHEIKTTRTRKSQEGVCLWKQLLPQLWCHVMFLVDMTRVIRQRKDVIMHSWLTHLQVLT
ncbi:hypothetical protein Tco_1041267 [Tanacetum coccineum]|uniref:Uncharacterized protein n=1 Tax=Tanacetum coccineum TaxID=301880 RepID=A0ABQ5GI54_9ASTR